MLIMGREKPIHRNSKTFNQEAQDRQEYRGFNQKHNSNSPSFPYGCPHFGVKALNRTQKKQIS